MLDFESWSISNVVPKKLA